MFRIFKSIIFITFLIVLTSFLFNNSIPVNFIYKDIVVEISTFYLILSLAFVILLFLFLQRFLFFFKSISHNYKINSKISNYKKGHESFVKGIVAIANQEHKKAINESQKINKYLKDNSLSLLLTSESLKIEKKYDQLYEVYENMLKNPSTHFLGLRGLMEQNLNAQDYHHALVYAEKLFYKNPNINNIYETISNIIAKTNNWQKLIDITDQAFKNKIINKNQYSENKSIGLYEVAKIKYLSNQNEALDLIENSLKLKNYFPPFVCLYIEILINLGKINKAKKYLIKAWAFFPHPDLKIWIKKLAKELNISYSKFAKAFVANSNNIDETKIMHTESLIDSKMWKEAREEIKTLLNHNPLKEVCLLMAKIEEGDSNDPQKINAWVSRSNYANLNKIWVCKFTGISQINWTSLSDTGYFNSLNWSQQKDDRVNYNYDINQSIESKI